MSKLKMVLIFFVSFFAAQVASAQATESTGSFLEQYLLEIVLTLAAVVCVLALLALMVVLYALRSILKIKQIKAGAEAPEPESFWQRFWSKWNNAVAIEEEHTVMTDHAYDGIKELDNRLPPWWLYGFYFTIAFGVFYLLNFHVFKTSELSAAEYETEMAAAEAEVKAYLASLDNLIDETNVEFTDDAAALASGQEIFIGKCAACHGNGGEGGVGPNLTDKYWLHGGDVPAIFSTIKYGVPAKGMISWKAQLSPKEIQQVASYIYTLEGTNPPNQKEPQGELFERAQKTDAQSIVDEENS